MFTTVTTHGAGPLENLRLSRAADTPVKESHPWL